MFESIPPFWLYTGFIVLVGFLLALDLGILNRRPHVISVKEALKWTALWVSLALAFNVAIYFAAGIVPAKQFLSGYLLEQSLSVDNIFVIILILRYFKVPAQYHHKVLFWGIVGAIIMRGIMIGLGTILIEQFDWIFFIFGAFLVYTGIKMAFDSEEETDLNQNIVVRYGRKLLRLTPEYHEDKFTFMRQGLRYFTPLFLVVIVVEFTDLAFAVDSIPAIFAVTNDGFIVFTSNIFAILGLRSLFFAVSGVMGIFHYLKYGLSLVLTFIGVKLFIKHWFEIPDDIALIALVVILAGSIVASLIWKHETD